MRIIRTLGRVRSSKRLIILDRCSAEHLEPLTRKPRVRIDPVPSVHVGDRGKLEPDARASRSVRIANTADADA